MNSSSNNYFVHQSAIVDDGAEIGEDSKIWHFSHIMPKASIGSNCVLGQNTFVANDVRIGDRCRIQNNVSVYTGVEMASDVFVGPSVVFTNVLNPRAEVSRKDEFKQTKIEKGVSIGANATIICGVSIGSYAFIGAGTVVTRDVKPFALIVGVPGDRIGWMSAAGARLNFIGNKATCPISRETYSLQNEEVVRI